MSFLGGTMDPNTHVPGDNIPPGLPPVSTGSDWQKQAIAAARASMPAPAQISDQPIVSDANPQIADWERHLQQPAAANPQVPVPTVSMPPAAQWQAQPNAQLPP